MRYEIKGLKDLKKVLDKLDDQDRIALNLEDGNIYAFRFYDNKITLHEIIKRIGEPK